jgi:hypothetical protein
MSGYIYAWNNDVGMYIKSYIFGSSQSMQLIKGQVQIQT